MISEVRRANLMAARRSVLDAIIALLREAGEADRKYDALGQPRPTLTALAAHLLDAIDEEAHQ